MTFKINDKVESICNDEPTGQIGTVTSIDSKGVVYVSPDDVPYHECRYLPDGVAIDTRPNMTYSIKKLDNQAKGH